MDGDVDGLERNSSSRNYSRTKTKLTKQQEAANPTMGEKIDILAETPTRRIAAALTSMLWEDLAKSPKKEGLRDQLSNRKKVQSAEKMIRGAYVELYKLLGLLKAYR